jgi:hypothetical protein
MNSVQPGNSRWPSWETAVVLLAISGLMGCRSIEVGTTTLPSWDLERAELLEWKADDPAFAQHRALEASGMAVYDESLYVSSEKYARLIHIDSGSLEARVLRLDVPQFAELEGVAIHGGTAYLCDEAHAAVHVVDLTVEPTHGSYSSRSLPLSGVSVVGGKIGYEGVALSSDAALLYLLLERSRGADTGCVSKIFRMAIETDALVARQDPIIVELEDCNWRLVALEMWRGHLLALKTQYPGERYQLIAIDPQTGDHQLVLEMTELLRSVTADGWTNNVEGLGITEDGTLYLVGDNAVTGVVYYPVPPPIDELTLLMRIPTVDGP